MEHSTIRRKGEIAVIRSVVLPAGSRAAQVPADTADTPLVMRARGTLLEDASIGSEATIETMAGRRLSGTLEADLPAYTHSFGPVIPELIAVHRQVKDLLYGGEAQ